jgi:SAM-dependent methyltransferase
MSATFRARTNCALCGATALEPAISLAATPPANEFVQEDRRATPQDLIPLTLILCGRCGHLQLKEIVDPERLFRHYVYVSGTSPVFVGHFREYATRMVSRFALGSRSFVLDIGSNDGTLLDQFRAAGVGKILGVDPASEIARDAERAGISTVEAFFTANLGEQLKAARGPADLICANNVFAHTENLVDFGRGIKALLADEGVFVFEVSYLVDVIEKLLFDTIYHEHTSYHAVSPLIGFFQSLGLRLFDAERMETHGGSLRCYVAHEGASYPDSERLRGLRTREEQMGLLSLGPYAAFKARISERGAELRRRIRAIRDSGQRIAGFGAPAKLTTLMHELGLRGEDIEFIVDDSPWKQGKFTPGMHIPVVPPSQLYQRGPAWCLVFAWNFAESIVAKHRAFIKDAGGRFLIPLPEMREVP